MCWPDYSTAKDVIELWKDSSLRLPEIDNGDDILKHRSTERWAVKDLLNYLEENWFENEPSELIGDYIDDCRYRAEKYREREIGESYQIAYETAEEILFLFV